MTWFADTMRLRMPRLSKKTLRVVRDLRERAIRKSRTTLEKVDRMNSSSRIGRRILAAAAKLDVSPPSVKLPPETVAISAAAVVSSSKKLSSKRHVRFLVTLVAVSLMQSMSSRGFGLTS